MALQVRDVGRRELSELAGVLASAFQDTQQWRWLLPDDAARAKVLPAFFRPLLKHALHRGNIAVAADQESVQGVAVWLTYPHVSVPKWRSLELFPTMLAALDRTQLRQFGDRGRAIDRAATAAHPTFPHRYLAALAVSPQAQGRGVGGALVHGGASHTAYLECEEPLVSYYSRFGFTEYVRIEPGGGVPVQIGMMRRDPTEPPH